MHPQHHPRRAFRRKPRRSAENWRQSPTPCSAWSTSVPSMRAPSHGSPSIASGSSATRRRRRAGQSANPSRQRPASRCNCAGFECRFGILRREPENLGKACARGVVGAEVAETETKGEPRLDRSRIGRHRLTVRGRRFDLAKLLGACMTEPQEQAGLGDPRRDRRRRDLPGFLPVARLHRRQGGVDRRVGVTRIAGQGAPPEPARGVEIAAAVLGDARRVKQVRTGLACRERHTIIFKRGGCVARGEARIAQKPLRRRVVSGNCRADFNGSGAGKSSELLVIVRPSDHIEIWVVGCLCRRSRA